MVARPSAGVKYLRMTTFENADVAPGQKAVWYPWPYVEGLTLDEATNELAFIATGLYGKPSRAAASAHVATGRPTSALSFTASVTNCSLEGRRAPP